MRSFRTFSVFVAVSIVTFCFAHTTFAEGYTSLSPGIPFIGRALGGGLPKLLNTLVGASVAIAAVLAVIMVTIGGFRYMTTDSMFAMGSAKEQMTNAVVGLLIVLSSILILETINPQLVQMNIFSPATVPNR